MKERTKGLLIMLAGILAISPDAVLTRYLGEWGSDPWTTVFWKMAFAAPFSLGFAVYEAGGPRKLWASVLDARVYYALAMPLQAAVDTCFVLSFFYTTAANALLLINLNPLWCAILGRFLLGDVLPRRTFVALALSLGCIAIIFVPEILGRNAPGGGDDDPGYGEDVGVDFDYYDYDYDPGDASGNSTRARLLAGTSESSNMQESSTKGNAIAFATGLGLAAYITLVRHGSTRGERSNTNANANASANANANANANPSQTSDPAKEDGAKPPPLPETPKQPANLIGSTAGGVLIAMVVSLIVKRGRVLPHAWEEAAWKFWLVSIAQGASVGALFVAITIAPRMITGAEIGLCVLLEALLGPLFVYLAYGDAPSGWTVLGGSLLLGVLAVHEALPLFETAAAVVVRTSVRLRRSLLGNAAAGEDASGDGDGKGKGPGKGPGKAGDEPGHAAEASQRAVAPGSDGPSTITASPRGAEHSEC